MTHMCYYRRRPLTAKVLSTSVAGCFQFRYMRVPSPGRCFGASLTSQIDATASKLFPKGDTAPPPAISNGPAQVRLKSTSEIREANTVKANSAYVKFLKSFKAMSGFAMLLPLLLSAFAAGQVSSVQVNSSDTVFLNRNTVNVPFTAAQTAGNLNLVVIGWPDISATIASVTDTNGNNYVLATTNGATALPAAGDSQLGVSQAIYYAKNIVAGPNTVKVVFKQNTAVQSVRIVEYAGLDGTNPLDTSVSSTGNAMLADSGAVTTNSANDLLFAAGTITTVFTGSGIGFNTVLLNGLGDIMEDRVVNAVGSYNATSTLGGGRWVMQLVAFRAAFPSQTPPAFAAPTIASLSAPSGPETGGTALTITGTNFAPGAVVVFSNTGGVTASGVNCSVTASTTISCLTPSFPAGSTTIAVTNVDGQSASTSAFVFVASIPFSTATAPSITPGTGSTNGGTLVTISGSDFAAGAAVTINGLPADRVAVANVNTIQASVPANPAGLKTVVVTNPSGSGAALAGGYTYALGTTAINFVQVASVQPASSATVPVTYPLAQTLGNMNIVVIGWRDATATVQSVVDSAGNTYTLSFPATVGTGLSQAIYYAKNIKASASNTVTVTFTAAATSPDVRILEYSGLDTLTPLDDTNGQFGTGTLLDSGTTFTTVAGDLVVGASMAGGTVISASPTYSTVAATAGISVEHLIGPAATRLGATSIQDSNANWVMQAVSFKQAGIVQDFTVTVTSPTTVTVAAGSPATYTISVGPINGFNSPVTLSCSGLPLGTSCVFNPPTVTPAAAAVTSTLMLATTAATPVATSTVTLTGTGSGTFQSLSHDAPVTLTVTPPPPDFTITPTPLSPATIAAGASSTSTITVAALHGFNSAVALTCSVAPVATRGPTCAFNPTSVAGGSGTSTLTVSTTAATTASARYSSGLFYAMWLPIGGLALLGTGFTSRKKKLWGFVFCCLLFSGLIILPACGGSGGGGGGGGGGQPGTPAQVYTVTVTGTAGAVTHSQTVTVTVH